MSEVIQDDKVRQFIKQLIYVTKISISLLSGLLSSKDCQHLIKHENSHRHARGIIEKNYGT